MKPTKSPDPPSTRHCRHCRRELPLDGAHFHRHVRHKHGFREICRECRSRARKNSRRELYGNAARTLILKYARDIRAGVNIPSHEQLHYVLSQYLGGPEGLAREFHRQFTEAKPGCRLAVALIQTMVELSVQEEQLRNRREEERQTEMAQLSPEELRERMEQSLLALLDHHGWEVVPKDSLCEKCRCIAV